MNRNDADDVDQEMIGQGFMVCFYLGFGIWDLNHSGCTSQPPLSFQNLRKKFNEECRVRHTLALLHCMRRHRGRLNTASPRTTTKTTKAAGAYTPMPMYLPPKQHQRQQEGPGYQALVAGFALQEEMQHHRHSQQE